VGKRRQVQPQELFPVVVQHHLADGAAVAQQAIEILAGKGRQSSAAGPYRHFRRKAGEQRLGLRFGGGEGKIYRQPDDFLQGGNAFPGSCLTSGRASHTQGSALSHSYFSEA